MFYYIFYVLADLGGHSAVYSDSDPQFLAKNSKKIELLEICI